MRKPHVEDLIVERVVDRGGVKRQPRVNVVRQRGQELARFATEGEALDFATDLAVSDRLDVWAADAGGRTLTLVYQAREDSPRYALTTTLEETRTRKTRSRSLPLGKDAVRGAGMRSSIGAGKRGETARTKTELHRHEGRVNLRRRS